MDFLAKMYAEEQEKTAGTELQNLFDQMSISQLEEVLGIKTAAKEDDSKYSVKPKSWWEGQKGSARAVRTGLGKIIAKPELAKERIKTLLTHGLTGVAGGAAGGAALGAGVGRLLGKGKTRSGAAVGALGGLILGAIGGEAHGGYKADEKYLGDRGIKQTYWGLGRGKYTPEAAAKYLKDSQK